MNWKIKNDYKYIKVFSYIIRSSFIFYNIYKELNYRPDKMDKSKRNVINVIKIKLDYKFRMSCTIILRIKNEKNKKIEIKNN